MSKPNKSEQIKVTGMTCTSCESRIEKEIKKIDGIIELKTSYKDATVSVAYDEDRTNSAQIKKAIETAGYTVGGSDYSKIIGIIIIAIAIFLLGKNTAGFDMNSKLTTNASYLVLFVVGLFTSIHCVGMCGGIMLSQSITKNETKGWKSFLPTLQYNLGRVTAYTIIGGIVGALGAVLSISLMAKSALSIFAGLFMIVMGLNMAGFSFFRRFNIRMPWACSMKAKVKAPFLVGLLNGLMPCGPLQTMQLFALGSGSALKGALAMFAFSIGTVPLMLLFGAAAGLLSRNYTKRILTYSGFLVVFLGFTMTTRGLALSGININPVSAVATSSTSLAKVDAGAKATIQKGVQTIRMTADGNGYTPNVLYVQKDIPIKWIVNGAQITSCNNQIVVPTLNIQQDLKSGDTVIELPALTKDTNFSCWMGMIGGKIKVVDDIKAFDTSKDTTKVDQSTSNCCGGGSEGSSKPSIYGDDLSKVATSRLVIQANPILKPQAISFKGIEFEFEPLIGVAKPKIPVEINYNLKSFSTPAGKFEIINAKSGDVLKTTNSKGTSVKLAYTFKTSGTYAIYKDNQLINILHITDDKKVNLDTIRKKYLAN